MENSVADPQKINNGIALWHSDVTSDYVPEETQNINLKEYIHPYVHCSTIYNSQYMEAAQVPINKWVDKKALTHIHNRILLGHKKKKEILPFAIIWMT